MVAYDPAIEWVRAQNSLWSELSGSHIARWVGTDFTVGDGDELVFLDRSSPFRQLEAVRLEREDGPSFDLGIYQNDDTFGLSIKHSDAGPLLPSHWARVADLSDLPVGRIDRLEVHLDNRDGAEGDLIEVQLAIDNRMVLIAAAEVEVTRELPVLAWGDESLFVFTNPATADELSWKTPRLCTVRDVRDGVNVFP